MSLERHTLTPADIMDLRASLSYRGSDDSTSPRGVAYIVFIPSDDAFALHAYGQVWAQSPDPAILAQMLRCERAEPGFIRRVLDSVEDCTLASLAPDIAASVRIQRAAEARKQAEHAQAERERLANRASKINVALLNLDDL